MKLLSYTLRRPLLSSLVVPRRILSRSTLVGLSIAAMFVGCDTSDEGGSESEPTPLTHEQGHNLIQSTIQSRSQSLEDRLRFLDGDERLVNALNTMFGGSEEICEIYFTPEGEEIEECDTFEDEDTVEPIRVDFMEGTEDMISGLMEELTPELQVQDATQLTYRLNPRSFCEQETENGEWDEFDSEFAEDGRDEDFDSPPEDNRGDQRPVDPESEPQVELDEGCLEMMEREQPMIRLMEAGDGMNAEILVGQNQEVLMSATLNSQTARFGIELEALSRILKDLASEAGEDAERDPEFEGEGEGIDFNLEMRGAISLELDTSIDQVATFSFNVDRPISITGQVEGLDEINVNFPAAQDVISISSDSRTPSIRLGLSIPKLTQALSAPLQGEEWEYDDETGEERFIEAGPLHEITAVLGGLDLAFNLALVEEGINTTIDVGLGDESSTIHIDNQQVLKVDLNPNHNRQISINLDHSQLNEESTMISLASELHALNIDVDLSSISEIEAPEWLLNEMYRVAFTSAAGQLPAVEFLEEGLKVAAGRLEISADRADISHVAEGGQCIAGVESESEEPVIDQEDNLVSEEDHPLASLEVTTCGE